jgi:hypothetical protein
MTAGRVTTWSQRFLGTAALLLVAWQVAALAGLGRRVGVLLGVYGFVLHAVFGKAYSLVPAYFDRQLAIPEAPAVQFPLSVTGVVAMATGVALGVDWLRSAGSMLWLVGVLAFVGTLTWTVRTNPTGAETGTGETSADRARVDRVANAGMPVAVAYLAAGAYATAAAYGPLPSVLGAYPARASHLVAAGAAALLLFAVGFRLLPRFLVAHPPRGAVYLVLPAGAAGPALLAVGLPAGNLLRAGAALEALAVAGFAGTVWAMFVRSDRDRVGLWGPVLGGAAGVAAALLGLHFAFAGTTPGLTAAHFRLMTLGLLGLSVVGATYQFYPPAVGTLPGADDLTALASLGLLSGGLALEAAALAAVVPAAVSAGRLVGVAGAGAYAYLLVGIVAGKRRG